jgi:hypothetical protein
LIKDGAGESEESDEVAGVAVPEVIVISTTSKDDESKEVTQEQEGTSQFPIDVD